MFTSTHSPASRGHQYTQSQPLRGWSQPGQKLSRNCPVCKGGHHGMEPLPDWRCRLRTQTWFFQGCLSHDWAAVICSHPHCQATLHALWTGCFQNESLNIQMISGHTIYENRSLTQIHRNLPRKPTPVAITNSPES